MNLDAKVPISRSLETERLYLRGAVAEDVPAVRAALIASWTELSRYLSWAQGAPPTLQEGIERVDYLNARFERSLRVDFFDF